MLLLSAALFFALLALHPFTTYPASLYVLRRLRTRTRPTRLAHGNEPTFAILVPAYNEERIIGSKIENLLALQGSVASCELLVYVDAATDRTAEILQPYADRITVVVGEVRRGKSHGLNVLVSRATADILVFTDANVLLDVAALHRLAVSFADPSVGCVSGHLKYGNGDESATAASGNMYWKLEERIRQLESDTVGIVGVDGSLFATRRSLHVTVPADIIDDFYVSMKILLAGHRVTRAPDAFAFERTGSDTREEFGRKVRIACQAFNVHRLLWGEIRRARSGIVYAYVSHRLLKWLIAYNLALAGVLTFAWMLIEMQPLHVAIIAASTGAGFAAGWMLGLRPFPQIGSILIAFAGVGWGVFRSLCGDRFQTWSPMNTARVRSDASR